jgi:hypothetical protein
MIRISGLGSSAASLLFLLASLAHPLLAQQQGGPGKVELTGMAGYQFGGSVGTSVGDLHLDAGVPYGGILGFRVRPDALVEVSYSYMSSSIGVINRLNAPDTTLGDLTTHQIQIGGMVEKLGGRVQPFGMGHLGMTIFDSKESQVGSETRFSAGLGGGLKIPTNSGRVGLRLQGRFWMTLFGSNGGFWCSLPGACAVSVSGTALVQGEFTGGIYLVP